MAALFIAFEGIDGAGKSTAAEWFYDELAKAGVDVLRTREPGGTPLAERVRELVLWGVPHLDEDFPNWAEVCLYMASRCLHLENMIKPRMAEGSTIVTDRFVDSTYAHQGGGRQLSIPDLKQMHRIVCGGFMPDITFLFDGDPDVFLQRMSGKKKDRLELQPIEFQHRSRQVHLDLMAEDPERYVLIDATQSEMSVRAQLMPHVMAIVNRIHARPAT